MLRIWSRLCGIFCCSVKTRVQLETTLHGQHQSAQYQSHRRDQGPWAQHERGCWWHGWATDVAPEIFNCGNDHALILFHDWMDSSHEKLWISREDLLSLNGLEEVQSLKKRWPTIISVHCFFLKKVPCMALRSHKMALMTLLLVVFGNHGEPQKAFPDFKPS